MTTTTRPQSGTGPTTVDPLERFRDQWTVLLTTYRRDGTPVETPVNIAVAGSVAYVRTFDPSGKLKRLRHDPAIEIAPCTVRGRPTGPSVSGRARILAGDEANVAAEALGEKYPFWQRRLVPWAHRRKHVVTTLVELRVG
jgi:uncharacterized protein